METGIRFTGAVYNGKTDFAGVYTVTLRRNGFKAKRHYANLKHNGMNWRSKYFKSEREAALEYDKKCIEWGLPPKNILKPKPR